MKRRGFLIFSFCFLSLFLLANVCGTLAAERKASWPKILTLTTTAPQTVGGIMGTSLAKQIEDQLGIPTTITQGHPVERAHLIAHGEAELGMLGSDVLYAAIRGTGDFANEGKSPVRFVTAMYPMLMHILSRKEITSFSDIRGMKCMFDNPATPMQMDMIDALLKYHGMTRKDIIVIKHTRSQEVSDALIAGTVDVGIRIGQLAGTATIKNLVSKVNISFVSLTDAEANFVVEQVPFFAKYTLKAGIYKGQNQPVEIVGVNSNWVAHKDLPDDLVYAIAKILMDSCGKDTPGNFTNYHPNLAWTLQDNVDFLYKKIAPFHPGVVSYLKDRGVWKPEMDVIQAELEKIAQ